MSIVLFVSLECFYHFDDVGLALLGKDMPNFLVCVLYAIFACLDAMCWFLDPLKHNWINLGI